jgi:hypothetical protein
MTKSDSLDRRQRVARFVDASHCRRAARPARAQAERSPAALWRAIGDICNLVERDERRNDLTAARSEHPML